MQTLSDKFISYGKSMAAKVADGTLDPESAGQDIAEMIARAFARDPDLDDLLQVPAE
jgi:hypothetical protein